MGSTNIQTAIRVRPLIEREKKEKLETMWLVKENSIVQLDSYQNFVGEPYSFDHIFDHTKSNQDVYNSVVKPLVMSCLEGIHATIFAYGQTSSGKTHTMLGDKNVPGIISYAVQDIFSYIKETSTRDFLLRCSYLEIYNEKINDLLDTNATDIKIREGYDSGVYVEAKEEVIREPLELFNIMKRGMKTRKIGCTDMNERSSRSHTIFKLVIHSQNKGDSEVSKTTESTLSLVDLAGSERVGQMNMGGVRQAEGVSINKSLTTLGLVIRKLSENETYINYRDSKLTRLLQDSLGGNSSTLIIATVTVAAEETKSTLEFAQRAKKVKNRPIINEKVTDKEQLKQYEHLCQDYKKQVEKLRLEKMEREKTIEALEGKIGNIKLFTAGNDERPRSRIPSRRHTLGFYKSHAKLGLPIFNDECDQDEFIKPLPLSPVKSEICFRMSNSDDKENSIIQSPPLTPINCQEFKFLEPPKTPYSSLKTEKVLLEESYENLKEFTTFEKLLQDKGDEVQELQKIIDNLRNENCKLQEQKLKWQEMVHEDNTYLSDRLVLLENILKRDEPSKRGSLTTILEEELELFSDNIETSDHSIDSDSLNSKEDEELNKLKQLVEQFKCDLSNKDMELTILTEEIRNCRNKIIQKDEIIENLQKKIIQEQDVKEAELEILNNKIIKSNQYKEMMHTEIAKLKCQNEELQNQCNTESEKNTINDLRALCDNLRSKLTFTESQVSDLQKTNMALEDKLQNSIAELQAYDILKGEMEQLKSDEKNDADKLREANVEEINRLQSELCNRKSEIQKLISDLESSQSQLAGKQQELECTSQELDLSKKRINDLEASVLELETKLTSNATELQDLVALKRQKDLLISENDNKDKQIELLQNSNDELKNNGSLLAEKELQIKHLNSEIEKLQTELDDVNFQLTGEQQELESTNQQLELAKQHVKHLTAEVLALEAEVTNSKSGHQECDSLKHQLDLLKSESVNKDQKIEILEKSNHDLNNEIASVAEKDKKLEGLNIELLEQKSQLEKLESDLKDAYSQINRKQQELEDTVRELESVKQHIVDYETKVVSLQSDLLKVTLQIQEYDSQEKQLNQLKSDCIFKDDEILILKKSSQDLIAELKERNESEKTLKDEIDHLNSQSLSKDAEIGELRNTIDNLMGQITLLEQNMKELKSQLLDKITELDLLQSENCKINVLQKANSDQLKERNEYNEKVKVLEEQICQLKGENLNKDTQINKLEGTVNNLLEQISILEKNINNLQSELVREKTTQLDSLQSENSKIEVLQKSNSDLNEKISTLAEQGQRVEQVASEQKLQIEKLKSELNCKCQELDFAKQQVQEFKAKVVNLETQLNVRTSEINDSLKHELDLLKSEGANKDKEINKLQKSNDYLNQKIAEKDAEILKKQEDLKYATQEFQVTKEHISNLKTKITDLEAALKNSAIELQNYESLKGQLNLLKSESVTKDQDIHKLRKSLEDNVCNMESLQNSIFTLKNSREESIKEVLHLKSKLVQTETKLQEKVRHIESLENTIATLQSSRDQSIKEVSHLKSKLAQTEKDLEIKNSKKLKDIENLSEIEYARIQDLLIARERDLTNKIEENENLKKENYNLNQKIRHLQVEINDLKTKMRESYKDASEVDDLRMQLRILESEAKEKKLQAQYAREDYLTLKRSYNSLEEKLLLSKKELADQKKLSTKSEKTLEIIKNVMEKNDFGLKYMPFEQQLTELILKVKSLSKDLAEAHAEVNLKSSQLSTAQAELSKISSDHQSCIKSIENLTREKNDLQYKLAEAEKSLAREQKKIELNAEELVQAERRCKDLQEKLKLQRDKMISFKEKLSAKEQEVLSLEAKVGELLKFKKTLQDSQEKIVVPRRSDESSRSMSPNDLRKVKRQLLLDQRRGLSPDIASSDEDSNGCETCVKLNTKISYLKTVNEILKEQMGELNSDIRDLDKENEDLEIKVKNMEERRDSLEKENADLRVTISWLSKQSNSKGNGPNVEKGVQVECNSDIQEKLELYKKLAVTRRKEANILRSKLGLPLDCPVLQMQKNHDDVP